MEGYSFEQMTAEERSEVVEAWISGKLLEVWDVSSWVTPYDHQLEYLDPAKCYRLKKLIVPAVGKVYTFLRDTRQALCISEYRLCGIVSGFYMLSEDGILEIHSCEEWSSRFRSNCRNIDATSFYSNVYKKESSNV